MIVFALILFLIEGIINCFSVYVSKNVLLINFIVFVVSLSVFLIGVFIMFNGLRIKYVDEYEINILVSVNCCNCVIFE